MQQIILFLVWIVPFLSEALRQPPNNTSCLLNIQVANASLADRAIEKVHMLPEVRAREKYIQKITDGKQGVTLLARAKPTLQEPFYVIQVGYNNPDRLIVYYTFYVYPKNMHIKVLDAVSGKVITTLSEWRTKGAR
ncbi:hypothetical protein QNI19_12475 [Cytophagaceae bacterium DM2B3-1]|uniref:PepSY domain-containing protein n=1 Tax=Xanthocytophaga flava TaxID=3048013 RepID=A0ABT7CM68_9BACT|nr:hypothetical protein [Xanthocytophaga flavus]MDJ1493749.1 hypothetical protein [Xanthocytophaga flavus]